MMDASVKHDNVKLAEMAARMNSFDYKEDKTLVDDLGNQVEKLVSTDYPHIPTFNSALQIKAELAKNHIHPPRGSIDKAWLVGNMHKDMVHFDEAMWKELVEEVAGRPSFSLRWNQYYYSALGAPGHMGSYAWKESKLGEGFK